MMRWIYRLNSKADFGIFVNFIPGFFSSVVVLCLVVGFVLITACMMEEDEDTHFLL